MIKIAITGNIASGKSTVERIIEAKGFKVFDTDKIAHEILASNEIVKEEFGTVDRKEIAKAVFANPERLKVLESIIHPLVKIELDKIFESDEDIIFISVPQLFEAGFETLFDKVIYITADENTRIERLMKRNSFTLEEAQKRIDAQAEEGKKDKSDFIIENNSTTAELERQVDALLSVLIG